jgi:hypothetical protein
MDRLARFPISSAGFLAELLSKKEWVCDLIYEMASDCEQKIYMSCFADQP